MGTRISGLYSGLDTDALVNSLISKHQNKIDQIKTEQKSLEIKQESYDALNTKVYSFYAGTLSSMRKSGSYNDYKVTSSSNALSVSGNVSSDVSVKIFNKATTAKITGATLDSNITNKTKASELGLESGTYKFNGNDIEINENDTLKSILDKISQTGVNATFDENQHKVFISAKESGSAGNFDESDFMNTAALINALGIPPQTFFKDGKYYSDAKFENEIIDENILNEIRGGHAAIRIAGEDAKIMVDGSTYTSSKNTFSINNATYTINSETNEDITVSSSRNISGTYDKIEKLIKDYNDVINELSKAYNTSNDGYKPLTDEEKEKMTESQIKKWEEKLSASSLYKDESIGNVINSLKNVMQQGIGMSDGTTMYLSSFGIEKGEYLTTSKNERNAYKINGDSDFGSAGNKHNTLEDMIENNPEKVEEFFKKLSDKVYDTLTKKMASTPLKNVYKIYNDKQIKSQMTDLAKKSENAEKKMLKAEEQYYKKFTEMEKALAMLQSQNDSLGALFNVQK